MTATAARPAPYQDVIDAARALLRADDLCIDNRDEKEALRQALIALRQSERVAA